MPLFDLPLEVLRSRRTERLEPHDLDAFWSLQLDTARRLARPPLLEEYRPGLLGGIRAFDVTFSGADGHPIRAWYIRPAGDERPLPCLIEFIGYGGGRGLPHERALYPACGYAILVMDTRGQGGWTALGATGDPGAGSGGPAHPGVMTLGIEAPETYYYTRLYVDAVRAVETAAALPGVDAGRLGVAGRSQGGALALAAAALTPESVRLCCASIPFLCDIVRGSQLSPEIPYRELAQYMALHVDRVEAIQRTLDYADCAHLASRIRARTFMGVGLMDAVCPPSTVFAAYNAIPGEKEMFVSPYGQHVGSSLYEERALELFNRHVAGSRA